MRLVIYFLFACLVLGNVENSEAGKTCPTHDSIWHISLLGDIMTGEVNLLPECEMTEMIRKEMRVIRKYLRSFPFENKAICVKETTELPLVLVDELATCVSDSCAGNLLGLILKAFDEDAYNVFKSFKGPVKEKIKTGFRFLIHDKMDSTLKQICPETNMSPPFMHKLAEYLHEKGFKPEVIEPITTAVGILFKDPAIMDLKRAGQCKLSYFNENLETVMDGIDLPTVFGAVIDLKWKKKLFKSAWKLNSAANREEINETKAVFIQELERVVDESYNGASSTTVFTPMIFGCFFLLLLAQLM